MWKVACMGLSSGTQGSLHSLPAPQSRQSSSLKSQMGRCFPRGLVALNRTTRGACTCPETYLTHTCVHTPLWEQMTRCPWSRTDQPTLGSAVPPAALPVVLF